MLFCGCEKNISFNLKEAPSVLVVDAQIENNVYPTVILTRSFGFFDMISPQLLSNAFVHNADVEVSNGTQNQRLKEYAFPLGGSYTGYIYTIDTANPVNTFKGEFNKQYQLTITDSGMQYHAVTTIPLLTKHPDSVWFIHVPLYADSNARVMMIKTTDPRGLGNYIRYFTKRNTGPFLPGENSVFDDAIVDGTTYSIEVGQGIDRNNKPKADSNYFYKGDTVTLKFCDIDKGTFTFWNTWEFAQQSIGNPFAQPNKVISNIDNGALGVFSGYAAWYKTAIVK